MSPVCDNCLTHKTNIARLEDRYDMEKQEWMIRVIADIRLLLMLCEYEEHGKRPYVPEEGHR